MKFPVILIAAAMAVGASRPPQMLNPRYYDSSPYVETPPSSIRSSLRSPSYLSHDPFLRNSESISIKDDILSDGPPYDYREERNFFDFSPPTSSYLSSHKPPSFYQDRLSSFREDKFNAQDYKGPPPPVPKQEILKQMHYMQNERSNNSSKMQVVKFQKEQTSSQSTTTEHNQPLLTNQRANINHGTRGLGFASVIGVTSSDINPVALADSSSTTKAATAMHSTLSLHSPSTNEVHVSQQDQEEKHHAVTNALSTEILTAGAASTPLPKNPIEFPYTQTSTNIGVTLNDIASTTPAATTKMTSLKPDSNLDPLQNPSSQPPDSTMIFHEPPKVSYDFRTASQDLPMATHEKQSIESPRQNIHVPHVKQNFFLYETKSNIPFQPSHLQNHEKHHNNDYVAPLRFSIPTASTPTSLSISTTPMKLVYQSLDFSRSGLPLIAGSHSQAYTPQQNQVDVTQFEKLNSANNLDSNANTYTPQHSQLDLTNFGKFKPGNNLGPNLYTLIPQQNQIDLMNFEKLNSIPSLGNRMPSYYLLQNNEHHKPSAHAPSEIPLGSFAFLQSNGYPKQNTESNFEISLSNLDEKEYLQSPSNFAPSRSAIIGLEKHNPSLYEPFRLTDSMFANIELDHNSW